MPRNTVRVGVFIALVIFAVTLAGALWYSPDSEIAVPPMSPVASTASKPVRLEIPAIGVDATVQYVGITGNGDMGTPDNFTDVAWYKYGPVPGQLGSAVIDGHVDNGLSLAGVFKHLDNVKVGDDVYVIAADGSKLHFVVTDMEKYPYTSGPTQKIFGQTDAARLNLITCSGTWVPGARTYDERLVVYTKFEGS